MCVFGSPPTVNSRGDELSDRDMGALYGTQATGDAFVQHRTGSQFTPAQRGEMLYNWLTAGGPPKKVDPSKIFAEKEAMSGVEEKASAGQGINSLFGIGKSIGEMMPVAPQVAPDVGGPLIKLDVPKMIEPLNQSPMQPGVPYSATPIGGK